jgi:hypothetical protein
MLESAPTPVCPVLKKIHSELKEMGVLGHFRDEPIPRHVSVAVDFDRLFESLKSCFAMLISASVHRVVQCTEETFPAHLATLSGVLAYESLCALTASLQAKLRVFPLQQVGFAMFGGRTISFSARFPTLMASLIETFGVYESADGYHVYRADITWQNYSNRFGLGNKARFPVTALNDAITALKLSRVPLVEVNCTTSRQDPWWLIDSMLINEDEISELHGYGPKTSIYEKYEAFGAKFSCFSIFDVKRCTELTEVGSLMMYPGTFRSIAPTVIGSWSPPCLRPTPDDAPLLDDIIKNYSRPMQVFVFQFVPARMKYQEPMSTGSESPSEAPEAPVTTSKKRKTLGSPTIPPGVHIESVRKILEDNENAVREGLPYPAPNIAFYVRRVVSFYSHPVCENATRSELASKVYNACVAATL